jgi:hypothetical protein
LYIIITGQQKRAAINRNILMLLLFVDCRYFDINRAFSPIYFHIDFDESQIYEIDCAMIFKSIAIGAAIKHDMLHYCLNSYNQAIGMVKIGINVLLFFFVNGLKILSKPLYRATWSTHLLLYSL